MKLYKQNDQQWLEKHLHIADKLIHISFWCGQKTILMLMEQRKKLQIQHRSGKNVKRQITKLPSGANTACDKHSSVSGN